MDNKWHEEAKRLRRLQKQWTEKPCDYCDAGNHPFWRSTGWWHDIPDPEGIEGTQRVPCANG